MTLPLPLRPGHFAFLPTAFVLLHACTDPDGSASRETPDGSVDAGGDASGDARTTTDAAGGATADGGSRGGTGGTGGAGTGGVPLPEDGGGTGGRPDASDGALDGSDGGTPTSFERIVRDGTSLVTQSPRPAYGALVVASVGERSYVVESRRDVETGPFGLPWRSRFRLAAYDAGVEVWSHPVDPDDLIGDVVVHPSGDVTFSLERHPSDRMAYDLVRLDRDGQLVGTTTLAEPTTVPSSDHFTDPVPLFRMKSALADATTAGWVRLLADGEGLAVAFLSFVDVPSTDPLYTRMALGLATFDWQPASYVERWARVVEGPHTAQPAAWAYDELRWLEQAVRPFFARDESSGDLLVGRAWNSTRCGKNVATFAEFTAEDCTTSSVNPLENERLPLAVTRFDSAGTRLGTRVLAPDDDAAEQVPFALAARNGELAIVGSVVRMLPDGTKRTYPDANGFVDYDGYVAFHDAQGARLRSSDFNLGRGDVLAAIRWTEDGIVAVGSAGWDRWQGGMSISRGADPLFVWLSEDTTQSATRVLPLSSGVRHWNLHDVAVLDQALMGFGFSDAPMTHSADGNNTAERTFGPLQIRLSPP